MKVELVNRTGMSLLPFDSVGIPTQPLIRQVDSHRLGCLKVIAEGASALSSPIVVR